MVGAGVFLQQCLLIMVKFFGFRAELENQAPIKICAEIGYYTNIYIERYSTAQLIIISAIHLNPFVLLSHPKCFVLLIKAKCKAFRALLD